MRRTLICWITLGSVALAAPSALEQLRRQVTEQERQIRRLEVENERLRYMLTEAEFHSGDPLYGTQASGKTGIPEKVSDEDEIHVVATGDTLSRIAASHGVDVADIARLNDLSDPSMIHPGQKLRLPAAGPSSAAIAEAPAPAKGPVKGPAMVLPAKPSRPASHHAIRAGENLYRVSLRYGVDLGELMSANPGVDPHRLSIGQKIRIPDAGPMLAGGS